MRIIIKLLLLVVVFLCGIIFASSNVLNTPFQEVSLIKLNQTDESNDESFETITQAHEEKTYFIQNVAYGLETITTKFFNMIINILYEISRLFYS
ncbi:MAG TPA: hypothetical protein VK061_04355 [Bacillota bacterium]|nr:hypothetical protein [Bacillota bacterium]